MQISEDPVTIDVIRKLAIDVEQEHQRAEAYKQLLECMADRIRELELELDWERTAHCV